ncbi:flavin reductase family protein [Actinacidiphila sp. bgisy160]|uniref:flavin reductase family protein n=1 Tax=Actinacidiphila sp. bgisy160 TaxID=3413796 RepID=UPI003D725E56
MSQLAVPAATNSAVREVLGHFASGVLVVTADGPTGPIGLTCQSFVSLSLDPLLIAFAPARTSRTWPLVREAGAFGVNVLSAGQAATSAAFARSGADKFHGVPWSPGAGGAPLLQDVCAWLTCELWNEYDGGDHTLAVGRVLTVGADPGREPLIFHRSRYRELAPAVPECSL